MSPARYSIFMAPPAGSALWRFGSAVIGYDAETGLDVPLPPGLPDAAGWRGLTSEPRRYGFHGTLKPPFRLSDGTSEIDLLVAARTFAASRVPFHLPALGVAALGAFVALVPTERSGALDRLAGDCVRAFEPFRAPLNAAERERRLRAPLTERQAASLERWGYPYVFDDFRFHMTLTGSLPAERREPVRAALAERYAGIARRPALVAASVAVFRQPSPDERFRVLERFSFGG